MGFPLILEPLPYMVSTAAANIFFLPKNMCFPAWSWKQKRKSIGKEM